MRPLTILNLNFLPRTIMTIVIRFNPIDVSMDIISIGVFVFKFLKHLV